MLVIRLRRTGKKHEPTYRIVVTDQRKSVYSPYVEMLGTFNPKTKQVVIDKEKAIEWMKKGAKPSHTVSKIFVKEEMKHDSIVVKKFRAISKKELERQKAEDEAEKIKEQAEKEAAKEAFEAQVEQEKKEAPTEDPLQAAAAEAIAEDKAEEAEKVESEVKPAEKEEETKPVEKPVEAEKPADEKA
ncbi:TPA: 30S ribosomal protein S16 [Candidatus Berkelbacteria bacterium]|uniref:Small ribosomal subunit protein bS16 n=1 Tax=Berkelbacteria bacterium GW2011_GWE1_39_12 TaxID=1618337 RepID=A0A0G4B3X3_9BACT|nr:MAG: 30S ribosomal protein S16, small subunit ribosomal protein S16 [Berkelbacteria bacterium GW2011_GWE1_39_12]HBO60357.1 30S ribosomal protein S16 [Candidatus Berkelbacteria bacterium]